MSKKHIDKIRHELKILRREATQRQSGILMACALNIERELEKIEKEEEEI